MVGMPGGGKSTVGKAVAKRLGLPFVDCDHDIERRAGCSITQLFEHLGEAGFRELEAEALAALVGDEPLVLATGGGSVLRAANRELLRTRTRCIYLKASPERLWARVRRDRRRPLLQGADAEARLRAMSGERDPLYREVASIVVDTEGLSSTRIVDAVIERLASATQS